jgi:hypothetical protein
MSRKVRRGGMEAWNINRPMYVVDIDKSMAELYFVFQLNEDNLYTDQVKQDVLLLASREYHSIPNRLHEEQPRHLTPARSVTDRVLTKEEHAQNHCQIGNIGRALEVMRNGPSRGRVRGSDGFR